MPNVVRGVMLGIAALTPTYKCVGVPRVPPLISTSTLQAGGTESAQCELGFPSRLSNVSQASSAMRVCVALSGAGCHAITECQ